MSLCSCQVHDLTPIWQNLPESWRLSIGCQHTERPDVDFCLRKMYLFAFLTTFFLVVGKFCSASTSCRVRANRFLNRQLVGHVIATHQSLDAEDCMEQCVENQQCYSTNFHLDSRQCELNDRTRLSHPLHLIRASHVIHEDNPARDYVPCSDALCNKLEVCHVTKGRPKCSGKSFNEVIYLSTYLSIHLST